MLTAGKATERGQATGRAWKGGVFSPNDGTADPAKAAPAVAAALLKLGGTIHQNCAARGIELEGGRVSGVVTEAGVIKTRMAVLAGGAWASSFCRQLGIRFPQASIRQSILTVSPGASLAGRAVHTAGVSITRRGDGGYALAISGRGRVDVTPQFMRFSPQFLPMFAKRWRSLAPGGLEGVRSRPRDLEALAPRRADADGAHAHPRPEPPPKEGRETHRRAVELMPELARSRSSRTRWAGYIDATPDGVPGIGEIPTGARIHFGGGISGHGFGIGPGAGHLIADLATGAKPIVDPAPFDPADSASMWGKVADF